MAIAMFAIAAAMLVVAAMSLMLLTPYEYLLPEYPPTSVLGRSRCWEFCGTLISESIQRRGQL